MFQRKTEIPLMLVGLLMFASGLYAFYAESFTYYSDCSSCIDGIEVSGISKNLFGILLVGFGGFLAWRHR